MSASFRAGLRAGVPYAAAGFLLSLSFGVLAREVLGDAPLSADLRAILDDLWVERTGTRRYAGRSSRGAEVLIGSQDVDGVFTADPRIVPDAQKLEKLFLSLA